MGFCELTVRDGIFFLTLNDGGNNYLTEQSIAELQQKLKEIRSRSGLLSRGLLTTCAGGSFCYGVDYDNTSPVVVDELVYRMAEVVRELFDMPFPTVAAITGDVRTSLALALVLAHDDAAVLTDANFKMTEVRDGYGSLPSYLAALLRDKVSYPLITSSLVLQSVTMSGFMMSHWYVYEANGHTREAVVDKAIDIIISGIGKIRDGQAYITTRKSFFPESWKAVSEFLGDKQ